MLDRERPALVVGHLQVILVEETDALAQVRRQSPGVADGAEDPVRERIGEVGHEGLAIVECRYQVRGLTVSGQNGGHAVPQDPDRLMEDTVAAPDHRILAEAVRKAETGREDVRGDVVKSPRCISDAGVGDPAVHRKGAGGDVRNGVHGIGGLRRRRNRAGRVEREAGHAPVEALRERSEVLPADPEVEGQFRSRLPVVLDEPCVIVVMGGVVVVPVDEAGRGLSQQEGRKPLTLGAGRGVEWAVGVGRPEPIDRVGPALIVLVQIVGARLHTELDVVIPLVDVGGRLTEDIGGEIEVVPGLVVDPAEAFDLDVGQRRLVRIELGLERIGQGQREDVEGLAPRMQLVALVHARIGPPIVTAAEIEDDVGIDGPDIVHAEGLANNGLVEAGGAVAVVVPPFPRPVVQLGQAAEDPVGGTEGVIDS